MNEHEFTPEEIAAVRAGIQAARESMREWNEATRVDPVAMRTPLTPPSAYHRNDVPEANVDPPELPTLPLDRAFADLINRQCAENGSNTPDFILGNFLHSALCALDAAIASRDKWYGVKLEPGQKRCRDIDWEDVDHEEVTLNVGAIFKIGKRLWRLIKLPKKLQDEDGWEFEYTEVSHGDIDQRRTFTRSEVQWLYSHGAFVGHPVDAEGADL